MIWFTIKFHTHFWSRHLTFRWSKTLIAGPHLSGLEFSGHKVTAGNITFLMGWTRVTELIGSEYHAVRNIININILQNKNISFFYSWFRSFHVFFVFGIFGILVAWFSFNFCLSCPFCLAKYKQRLCNIFAFS